MRKSRREPLVKFALARITDGRLVELGGGLVSGHRLLPLGRMLACAGRGLAQQQLQILAPHRVHRSLKIGQRQHGRQRLVAYVQVLDGNVAEGEKCVSPQQNA
jgi:hypothetical protein